MVKELSLQQKTVEPGQMEKDAPAGQSGDGELGDTDVQSVSWGSESSPIAPPLACR